MSAPRPNRPGPPITGWVEGSPILDLTGMDDDARADALAPLNSFARRASLTSTDGGEKSHHLDVIAEAHYRAFLLSRRESDARDRDDPDAPLLTSSEISGEVAADREDQRRRRRYQQVNIKLTASEYAILEAAAAANGLKATQLARQLVVNGARRIAYEQRRLRGG